MCVYPSVSHQDGNARRTNLVSEDIMSNKKGTKFGHALVISLLKVWPRVGKVGRVTHHIIRACRSMSEALTSGMFDKSIKYIQTPLRQMCLCVGL